MDRSRVGIVIPALNESATIAAVVEAAGAYGRPIVVNDGSTDDTAATAARSGALVVSHDVNRGYDAALSSGFAKAAEVGCEVIVTLDADGQHDPAILGRMLEHIDRGADVVVGIRSRRQRIAESMFRLYTRMRFGIEDPLCGMKAYRTAVYRTLGHFDSYGSVGTELMLFAARRRFRIEQVPFTVREREGSAPRFGRTLRGNYRILRAMAIAMAAP